MTGYVSLDSRIYGIAQRLLMDHARHAETESAPARGLVDEQDAVDAIVMILAGLTEQVQAGRMEPGVATRLGALLMLVRDHVRPLPPGLTSDGTDMLTSDLAELVGVVRSLSRPATLPRQTATERRNQTPAARAESNQGVT
jgi:hypothetical protein